MTVEFGKKKRICLLMTALIFSLAACSGGQTSETTESREAATVLQAETTTSPEVTEPVTKRTPDESTKAVPEETMAEETEAEVQTEEAVKKDGLLHVIQENRSIGSTDQETSHCRVKISYPSFTLKKEDAADYPALEEALKTYSSTIADNFQSSMKDLEENFNEITKDNASMAEELELCNEMTSYVVRSDSIALSLLGTRYAYYGGAHPDHFVTCVNFDADSGKQLALSDVITDTEAFAQLVDEKLKEKYWDIYPTFFAIPQEELALIDTEGSGVAWSLGYEGITLYFNPYCLGSYAEGEQVIYLSFTELTDLMLPYYAIERASYVTPFVSGRPLYADAAGTGQTEEIAISEVPFDGDEYGHNVTVSAANRSCDPDAYAFSEEAYLVKDSGRYYVWLFTSSENDYILLSSIDLKTMGCDREKQSNLFLRTLEGDWESTDTGYVTWGRKEVFTDPSAVELGTRITLLSSVTGLKTYHAGADGWPESEEKLYRIEGANALRTKRKISAELVDEAGLVTGSETIPAGTVLRFVRGDGSTFADFQVVEPENAEVSEYGDSVLISLKEETAADYSRPVYRIYEDMGSWPYKVDGKEESSCFEGNMYAG